MIISRFGAAISKRRSRYNAASGGTEATISNYNGTGETWKTHTFTSSGTLTVSSSANTFRILTVGGGGSGTVRQGDSYGAGGGGGGIVDNSSATLSIGSHAVTVGNAGIQNGTLWPGRPPSGGSSSVAGLYVAGGGQGGNTLDRSGSSGTPQSNLGGLYFPAGPYTVGGGGGGAGGAGGNASGGAGGNGGAGAFSTASGTNTLYGVGGTATLFTAGVTNAAKGSGGGSDASGREGIVIVAYRIG
jgi:hypothetical protein